jgi:putative restriction endonuclease
VGLAGENFQEEREKGILWAPRRLKDGGSPKFYWSNMTKVQPGDVIFSYVGGEIVAVSEAQGIATTANNPFPEGRRAARAARG